MVLDLQQRPSNCTGDTPCRDRTAQHTPPVPRSLEETGLDLVFLADLVLKIIYKAGVITGSNLSRTLCLPFEIVDSALNFLKDEKYLEIKKAGDLGRVTGNYGLLERGRERAKDAFAQSQYCGAAPIPLDVYRRQVEAQSVKMIHFGPDDLSEAFADLVLDDRFYNEIGPAANSGKSIFLYGPPGNGKTSIAKRIAAAFERKGGTIFVPQAVVVDDIVITLYDPIHHRPLQSPETDSVLPMKLQRKSFDRRWVPCCRPVVVVGGELTLDMLDLRFNPTTNFYDAPIHVKANGGVLVLDDFGRQRVDPKDLLNRWIVPLEEQHDYLSLHTGKKFQVPFDQLTFFATNLDPEKLADEAFLRRIRYQIEMDGPDREVYENIFALACRERGVEYECSVVEQLYTDFYPQAGRPPRGSDPRDLVERLIDIARYRDTPPEKCLAHLDVAATGFFRIG